MCHFFLKGVEKFESVFAQTKEKIKQQCRVGGQNKKNQSFVDSIW